MNTGLQDEILGEQGLGPAKQTKAGKPDQPKRTPMISINMEPLVRNPQFFELDNSSKGVLLSALLYFAANFPSRPARVLGNPVSETDMALNMKVLKSERAQTALSIKTLAMKGFLLREPDGAYFVPQQATLTQIKRKGPSRHLAKAKDMAGKMFLLERRSPLLKDKEQLNDHRGLRLGFNTTPRKTKYRASAQEPEFEFSIVASVNVPNMQEAKDYVFEKLSSVKHDQFEHYGLSELEVLKEIFTAFDPDVKLCRCSKALESYLDQKFHNGFFNKKQQKNKAVEGGRESTVVSSPEEKHANQNNVFTLLKDPKDGLGRDEPVVATNRGEKDQKSDSTFVDPIKNDKSLSECHSKSDKSALESILSPLEVSKGHPEENNRSESLKIDPDGQSLQPVEDDSIFNTIETKKTLQEKQGIVQEPKPDYENTDIGSIKEELLTKNPVDQSGQFGHTVEPTNQGENPTVTEIEEKVQIMTDMVKARKLAQDHKKAKPAKKGVFEDPDFTESLWINPHPVYDALIDFQDVRKYVPHEEIVNLYNKWFTCGGPAMGVVSPKRKKYIENFWHQVLHFMFKQKLLEKGFKTTIQKGLLFVQAYFRFCAEDPYLNGTDSRRFGQKFLFEDIVKLDRIASMIERHGQLILENTDWLIFLHVDWLKFSGGSRQGSHSLVLASYLAAIEQNEIISPSVERSLIDNISSDLLLHRPTMPINSSPHFHFGKEDEFMRNFGLETLDCNELLEKAGIDEYPIQEIVLQRYS